jgi:hypothetical protein
MTRGQPDNLAAVLKAVAEHAVPDLDDAACAGLAPLHDDDVIGESEEQREARWWRAIATCNQCPAIEACAAARGDANGIWGGQIHAGTWRKKAQ